MLRKFSHTRTFGDNIKLGTLTAFTAGMVNVASLVLFFSFVSNITGHYAILADEIANGKWFQVLIVLLWISLFFSGSFLSNLIVINGKRNQAYLTHAIPLLLEIACFLGVGFYGRYVYKESLMETEMLIAVLLFAMGLQNGLTASISNFAVKTTHLTGLTTDLAIHLSMLTQARHRKNPLIWQKVQLFMAIALSYLAGGIVAGSLTHYFGFRVFFYISLAMTVILVYDFSKIYLGIRLYRRKKARYTAFSRSLKTRSAVVEKQA